MGNEIQDRIIVGQAFNLEANRVLHNAKIEGKVLTSQQMNAEIKAGMSHTVLSIKSFQDSMVNATQQSNQAFQPKPVVKPQQPVVAQTYNFD